MSEFGDNLRVDLQFRNKETFFKAFELVGMMHSAKGYIDDPEKGLVFLWAVGDGVKGNPFPCAYGGNMMAEIAWAWLQEQWHPPLRSSKDNLSKHRNLSPHGEDLDHDGSNVEGWRIYNETWGHVGDHHYAIVAVQPAYIWMGK